MIGKISCSQRCVVFKQIICTRATAALLAVQVSGARIKAAQQAIVMLTAVTGFFLNN